MSGPEFLSVAQDLYTTEKDKTFELYQLCIQKIMKDEDVLQSIFPGGRRPPDVPADVPSEALALAFRNFIAYFRDPTLNYTEGEPHYSSSYQWVLREALLQPDRRDPTQRPQVPRELLLNPSEEHRPFQFREGIPSEVPPNRRMSHSRASCMGRQR